MSKEQPVELLHGSSLIEQEMRLTVHGLVGLGKGVDVGWRVHEFEVGNDAEVVLAVVSVLQVQANDRQVMVRLASGVVGMLERSKGCSMKRSIQPAFKLSHNSLSP